MTLDLRRALFAEMAIVQVGMLGVQGEALPLQPMVHLMAAGSPDMWFMSEPDSDLVKAIDGAATGIPVAAYCFTGRNHDFHACLTGPVRLAPDRRGLERFWSITAEALFPGGLSGIDWTPLRVTITEAAVWASPKTAVMAGSEVVRPPLGETALTEVKSQILHFGGA